MFKAIISKKSLLLFMFNFVVYGILSRKFKKWLKRREVVVVKEPRQSNKTTL